jgi:hypothetical protein
VVQEQAAWRARFEGMGKSVVLVGYDDMEPLSGLTLKLKALQSMLALFPEYRQHTLLVQVSRIPPRTPASPHSPPAQMARPRGRRVPAAGRVLPCGVCRPLCACCGRSGSAAPRAAVRRPIRGGSGAACCRSAHGASAAWRVGSPCTTVSTERSLTTRRAAPQPDHTSCGAACRGHAASGLCLAHSTRPAPLLLAHVRLGSARGVLMELDLSRQRAVPRPCEDEVAWSGAAWRVTGDGARGRQVAIPLYDSRGELMHMHYMEEVQTLAASINKVPCPLCHKKHERQLEAHRLRVAPCRRGGGADGMVGGAGRAMAWQDGSECGGGCRCTRTRCCCCRRSCPSRRGARSSRPRTPSSTPPSATASVSSPSSTSSPPRCPPAPPPPAVGRRAAAGPVRRAAAGPVRRAAAGPVLR